MFVLEGLANEGIQKLWDKLPRPQEEGRYIVNSLSFNVYIKFSRLISVHSTKNYM